MYAGTDERRIVLQAQSTSQGVVLEVEDAEIESTGRWIGESKSPS